jgi:hypothetical protein|tara:strand:+ start:99 stop:203 length:105 start_codon:yes stop_codon:yes gene_type:complete
MKKKLDSYRFFAVLLGVMRDKKINNSLKKEKIYE